MFSKMYHTSLWKKEFYSTETQSKLEHKGQLEWEQPKQSVLCPRTRAWLFRDCKEHILLLLWACWRFPSNCIHLWSMYIANPFEAGGIFMPAKRKELFDFSETTETRDITAPAFSTQLTVLKPLSPANIHLAPLLEIMDTFLSEKKMWYLKDQGLMDTFLIPETVLCATAILQQFSVTT